jgi:Tfp pilus assembly protein PilX
MRMFIRLHRDERGVTLIFALLATFVVLLLSIYVLDQSLRSQDQAARDRKRLTAENAAEAGLNWFFNNIQNAPATSNSTLQMTPYTGSLISGPNSVSFTATPSFYADTTGVTPFTGTLSATNFPLSAKIVSVGTSSNGTKRQMESFMALHPVYGGFDGAVISNSNTNFTNNFTITGNNGNDGDIVISTGNYSSTSGTQTVHGNIYVSSPGGTATIGTSEHVYGSVWATGSVTLSHSQAQVDGDAKSTSGGVTVSSGSVSGSAYYCTGSAPSNVAGAKIKTCTLGPPPSTAFPQVKFDANAWQSLGYYVQTFSGVTACADAQNYVEGNGTGSYKGGAGVPAGYTGVVVRIAANCTYTNSNNAVVNVGSNLAIVTDGGINITNKSTWNGVTTQRSLFFIHSWPSSGSYVCSPLDPDGVYELGDVALGNNTTFNNLVQVSVYTPCEAAMNNNNATFYGQVIGSSLTVANQFSMIYRPVLIPGAKVTGFKEDVAYVREVTVGS